MIVFTIGDIRGDAFLRFTFALVFLELPNFHYETRANNHSMSKNIGAALSACSHPIPTPNSAASAL
jgi:hypothetical protein